MRGWLLGIGGGRLLAGRWVRGIRLWVALRSRFLRGRLQWCGSA